MLTVERLRELLIYEPDTGLFTRRITVSNARGGRAGEVAGSINGAGYVYVIVDGSKHLAHRLAWLYMTGEWPTTGVDHRDHDEVNNRWNNLRLANQSMNNGNASVHADNPSGAKGVSHSQRLDKPWKARIHNRHLGHFATIEEAKAAYDKAAREIFGEFFRP
jgi:hypothetical protein